MWLSTSGITQNPDQIKCKFRWNTFHENKSFYIFIFFCSQINSIRKYSIDSQILSLNNLQILNLSDNRIENIPERLGDLPLVQLDLSKNLLGKSSPNDWKWANKLRIKSSLQNINLSHNDVSNFWPEEFGPKLFNIENLFVDHFLSTWIGKTSSTDGAST